MTRRDCQHPPSILVIWNPSIWSWPSSSPLLLLVCQQLSLHVLSPLILSSLGESLPYVPGAYSQTLEALLSQPAVSKNESHTPGDVSE
ncbi:hypothetical protein Tco_0682126 [Tanacetum coccineum]|uniref:Uncharacterized protein n=1 Tax=Tanacetum coccineum TaxID=301880 RepID=A0ABQ4XQA7_9ASTR